MFLGITSGHRVSSVSVAGAKMMCAAAGSLQVVSMVGYETPSLALE